MGITKRFFFTKKNIDLSKKSIKALKRKLKTSYLNVREQSGIKVLEWTDKPLFLPNKVTGWDHGKSRQVRHVLRSSSFIDWDVIYKYDDFGRRSDLKTNKLGKSFMIFLGCSFTHGNGLLFNQTLPFQTALHLDGVTSYNYGLSAGGPHQFLAMLRSKKLKEEITETQGTLIYVYLSQHVARSNGFMSNRILFHGQPVFKKVKNEMKVLGSFNNVEPLTTTFYRLISPLANFFEVSFPKESYTHYKYTCDLIESMKTEFQRQYPGSKFVVYVHPMSFIQQEVKKCLLKKEVHLLTPPSIVGLSIKKHQFKLDHHPNKFHNKTYGKILSNKIRSLGREIF